MRGWVLISVLALAGCGEHLGANPNYRFDGSPYGAYLTQREAALISNGAAPSVIPVARPFEAPTAEQIAGRSPVPVPATMGIGARRSSTVTASAPVAPVTAAPVTAAPATATAAAAAPAATAPARNAPLAANDGPYPGSVPVLHRYAAETRHAPGNALYARGPGSATLAAQACARFASPEAAQIAFLSAGGPRVDPRGMDPDGDGFVCGWDPRPLRQP